MADATSDIPPPFTARRRDRAQDPEQRLSIATWAIAALALGLSAWQIDVKNLWLDEAVSWEMASSSVRHLITATSADIHSPLYYLMLKAWMAFLGDSPAGLRSLSVAANLATLFLMRRLARGVLSAGPTWAALLWYAISPQTIAYGQEARMYAAATAAVVGMCLAYRRWVDSGFANRSALAAYAGCVTIALYLHYFTVFAVLAIWIHVGLLATGRYICAGRVCRPPWRDWLVAHAAVGVMLAPWIGTAVAQVTRGQAWRQPVSLAQIPDQIAELAHGLIFGAHSVPNSVLPCLVALSVLALGLACTIVRAVNAQSGERHAFFALLAVVPPLMGLAVQPITGHLDLSRYLLYTTPLLIMSAALGLSSLRVSPASVICALLAGGMAPLPSLRTYYASHVKDYDPRPIVTYLSNAARHGSQGAQDPILVAPGYVTDVLDYLSRGLSRELSRGTLAYQPVDTDADLIRLMTANASGTSSTWLIVDYRWPEFDGIARDPRFEAEEIPLGAPDRVKVFRLRAR